MTYPNLAEKPPSGAKLKADRERADHAESADHIHKAAITFTKLIIILY